MRTDRLKITRSVRLSQIKQSLRDILKNERTLGGKELQRIADEMYDKTQALVPVKTGALKESIIVKVSKSPRYPGIIAVATARNPKTGYDYALMQEEREDYQHPNGGQAHFLAEPFEEAVEEFFRVMGYDK